MKTINFTDPSADELLRAARSASLSIALSDEIIAALAPPVIVPPTGDLRAQAIAAAVAAGFSKCMFYDWDWAANTQFVQTYNDGQGPLGANGVVVIAFRPSAVTAPASISVSEYPGGYGNVRAVSVSERPCDFGQPFPLTLYGFNTGYQFTVAPTSQRGLPMLIPGKQYFLNVANRDSAGRATGGGQPEVRINATRPQ